LEQEKLVFEPHVLGAPKLEISENAAAVEAECQIKKIKK